MESRKETLGLLLVDVTHRMRRAFQQQLEGSSPPQGGAVVYVSLHEGVRPSPSCASASTGSWSDS